MTAKLIIKTRKYLDDDSFMDMVIWLVAPPVRASKHGYKYRLAYVERDVCVIRYDNEAGKGDHKHVGEIEIPTIFSSINKLIQDFKIDIQKHRRR